MAATQKSFGATGTSDTLRGSKFLLAATVPSAFSGTVKFKWTDDFGATHTVQESGSNLSFTAATERNNLRTYWSVT